MTWEAAGGAAAAEAGGGDVGAKAENASAYDGTPAPSASGASVSESDSVSTATGTWRDQALEGLDEALRIGNITQAEYDQGTRDVEAMGERREPLIPLTALPRSPRRDRRSWTRGCCERCHPG